MAVVIAFGEMLEGIGVGVGAIVLDFFEEKEKMRSSNR